MARADITLTAVDQTRGAFDSVKRNLSGLETVASSLNGVLAGIGAGLSAGALVGFVKSSIDAADNLGKLSQKVGVTVESLSELQYAGKLADVSTEQLGDGLRKLSVNLQAAAGGSKEMTQAFASVGISAAELVNLKPDEALRRIAEAFANTEDGAAKTALAVQLFGRSGSELIPFLNAGAAGLRAAGDEARRFGLVVSTASAKAAEQFNDNITRLTSSASALGIVLANSVLPTITRFTEELLEGQKIAGGFLEALALFGTINPFKNDASNLKSIRKEYDDLLAARERYVKSNADTSAIDQSLSALQKQIQFLQSRQRLQNEIDSRGSERPRNAAAARSAASRNAAAAPDVSAAATTTDTDLAAGAERGARIFTQIYLDQFNIIAARGKEVQQGLLEVFEAGNETDARNLKETADNLDRILGGTRSGQEGATLRDLEAINNALITGRINAEQYEEAYTGIQEKLNEIREIGKDAFQPVKDDGEKALRDLEFAVQGWGRNFTDTLATAIEGGRFQFSELVTSITRDLLRLQIQQTITRPIFNALNGALSQTSLFGVGGGTPPPGVPSPQNLKLAGTRASGGPVGAGAPYLVGEVGPELFIPRTSGTVVPNSALGGGMTLVVNVDARSDINAVRAAVRESAFLAQAEMARSARRGG